MATRITLNGFPYIERGSDTYGNRFFTIEVESEEEEHEDLCLDEYDGYDYSFVVDCNGDILLSDERSALPRNIPELKWTGTAGV